MEAVQKIEPQKNILPIHPEISPKPIAKTTAKRGRPPGSKNKPKTEKVEKKPIGRPKGSKNKKPYSEEILKKRSERMSGEKHPMFGKKGLENPNFGKKRPDVAERNKINPPAKGKLKSEETKARMRKPKTKRIVE